MVEAATNTMMYCAITSAPPLISAAAARCCGMRAKMRKNRGDGGAKAPPCAGGTVPPFYLVLS
eukprot:947184-Prymnesium_polylepis.2